MDQVKIVNIGTGITAVADIIQRSAMHMKVAIVDTTLTVTLSKNTPDEKNYTGRGFGMDFICNGEII